MTGTALTIREMLEQKQADIRQLLPAHVDVNRFIKSALLAVARNKDLQKCTPASVFTAIVNAAELGLDFTPVKGRAYLIPFNNHGVSEAMFMPGYRGFIHLATKNGPVTNIIPNLVYEKDVFEMTYGSEPRLFHKPCLDADRGAFKGAYAIAYLPGAFPIWNYMTKEKLEKIKNSSKAKSGPWQTWEEEMQLKSTVRGIFKILPSNDDVDRALEADNRATGLIDVDLIDAPTEDGEMTERLDAKLEAKVKGKKEPEQEPAAQEPTAQSTLIFEDILTMVQDIPTPEDMQDFKKKLAGYVSRLTPEQHKELIAACKAREVALIK